MKRSDLATGLEPPLKIHWIFRYHYYYFVCLEVLTNAIRQEKQIRLLTFEEKETKIFPSLQKNKTKKDECLSRKI